MFTVDNYEPGSNLTIMNVIYQRTKKDERTGKRLKDYAILIYIDNDNLVDYYVENDKVIINGKMMSIKIVKRS